MIVGRAAELAYSPIFFSKSQQEVDFFDCRGLLPPPPICYMSLSSTYCLNPTAFLFSHRILRISWSMAMWPAFITICICWARLESCWWSWIDIRFRSGCSRAFLHSFDTIVREIALIEIFSLLCFPIVHSRHAMLSRRHDSPFSWDFRHPQGLFFFFMFNVYAQPFGLWQTSPGH